MEQACQKDDLFQNTISKINEYSVERLSGLDGARGVAAVLVAFAHYFISVYKFPSESPLGFFSSFIGSYAVGLFFITSGFVVASSAHKSYASDFFVRRIFRLYPIAIVVVAIRMLVEFDLGNVRNLGWQDFAISASLFGSDLVPNEALVEPIYWTLSIEVKFYIIVGLVYFLSKKLGAEVLPSIFIIFSLLSVGHTYIMPHNSQWPWAVSFGVLASTLPMLILGWITWLYKSQAIGNAYFYAGLLCVFLSLLNAPYPIYFSLDKGAPSWLLSALTFFLILKDPFFLKFLKNRLFGFLGKISYPVYAIHSSLIILTINYLPGGINGLIMVSIFFGLLLLCSWFLNFSVEQPMISLSKKLLKMKLKKFG
ncbi:MULTISPECIES: acyltransferase [unclassified Pseudomonas]|uniref:acyltransferase family protein n=1 Tax=unclassified Pseudomonas TaxID=196821 RepID=UPI00131B1378|nr:MULTISPECIES: acyltransferase [unclassified Pseudomonas]